jgi:outer membrane protein assembly factor BamB
MRHAVLTTLMLLSSVLYSSASYANTQLSTCMVCGPGTYASGSTCLPDPAGTDPAVAYQINAAHTGNQPGSALRVPLAKRWSRSLGGTVSYPLIVGSRAFVTVANTGTYGSKLYALDSGTGATLWSADIAGTYYFSAAAYANGRVFVINYNGLLKAFDASSGALLWSKQLTGQYSFTSPPTAFNGTVFVGGAGSGGTLYAVSESTGAVLWTAPVANGDHSAAAVSSTGVYVSYACARTYDFSPSAGTSIWNYSTYCSGGGGKTPVLHDGRLYVRDASVGNVILDAATGASLGTFSANRAPAFDGNLGFFLNGSTLSAMNLTTNTLVWTFTGDNTLSSAPIVVNGHVIVGSTSGNLYALDKNTGAVVSSAAVGAGISAPDEHNAGQLTGLAAGNGLLLVPAGTQLAAY